MDETAMTPPILCVQSHFKALTLTVWGFSLFLFLEPKVTIFIDERLTRVLTSALHG